MHSARYYRLLRLYLPIDRCCLLSVFGEQHTFYRRDRSLHEQIHFRQPSCGCPPFFFRSVHLSAVRFVHYYLHLQPDSQPARQHLPESAEYGLRDADLQRNSPLLQPFFADMRSYQLAAAQTETADFAVDMTAADNIRIRFASVRRTDSPDTYCCTRPDIQLPAVAAVAFFRPDGNHTHPDPYRLPDRSRQAAGNCFYNYKNLPLLAEGNTTGHFAAGSPGDMRPAAGSFADNRRHFDTALQHPAVRPYATDILPPAEMCQSHPQRQSVHTPHLRAERRQNSLSLVLPYYNFLCMMKLISAFNKQKQAVGLCLRRCHPPKAQDV